MTSRFGRAAVSALVTAAIGACGGSKQAVPAEVEIQWPDAGVFVPQTTTPTQLDAGAVGADAMPQKAESQL